MNRHFTEEELTLYYYGEARRREDIDAHLGTCAACATTYKEIAATLAMIATPDAPARGEQYGLEVWQRIRHKLPEQNADRKSTRLNSHVAISYAVFCLN